MYTLLGQDELASTYISGKNVFEEHLFEDSDVEEQACSMKATSHCGAMTAGTMVAVFNNYITNVIRKTNFREVPFRTDFELPTITQNVQV